MLAGHESKTNSYTTCCNIFPIVVPPPRFQRQERRLGVIPGVQSVQDLKDRFGTLPLDDVTLQERGEQAAREKKNQEEIEAKRELDAGP